MRYIVQGMIIEKSRVYHGRYECIFHSRKGQEIKQWIRSTFGDDDDLVYTSSDIDGSSVGENCGALITESQLTLALLRWV